jgi:hypothetical protein
MMMLYFRTKRIEDVILRNKEVYSKEKLDKLSSRTDCLLYLAHIYREESSVELTAMDYRNLQDVIHVICLPNFGQVIQQQRVRITREVIKDIKKDDSILRKVLNDYLKESNYS